MAFLLCVIIMMGLIACAAPVEDTGGTTTTAASTTTIESTTITDDLSTSTTTQKSTVKSALPSTHGPTLSTTMSTTTSVENWPTKNERQKLIERYIYYTTLYESSMIDFLVELGLGTRRGIENRLILSPSTGVRERDFEEVIGETIVVETHRDRFLAENEVDNGEIVFVRPEKPLMTKMVGGIEPNGTTSVQVWGTTYTGYVHTVTVDVADGTMEVYNITVIYFFDEYVIAACEPVVA